MIDHGTDYWEATQAASLGSKMKVQDLHMVYNPISQLLKVFNAQGRMVKQVFATARTGSRGLCEPHQVGQAETFGPSDRPGAIIGWQYLDPSNPSHKLYYPNERFYFVRSDFPDDEWYLKGPLRCHLWEIDKGSFVDLFDVLERCQLGGGTVYFEIAGRHMIREDVLYAMEHAQG